MSFIHAVQLITPIMYYNKDMFDKAGIHRSSGQPGRNRRDRQDLLDKGGAGEVMSLGIYGWFFGAVHPRKTGP